jgi:homoserine O-acetyltransferase/O-succinyltransferase
MAEAAGHEFTAHEFTIAGAGFASGQRLDALRLRYLTAGTRRGNNAAVLIHNTTGSAETWLAPGLAGALFGPGQPLDLGEWFVIAPDMVGFGGSSKPSDGLRARFPNYRYADMVAQTERLVREAVGLDHVRLVLGISMGGMICWMWGERSPGFMDALVPVASQPGPMSGRNWMQRRIAIEAIRNDPTWKGGEYETPPSLYVNTAPYSALLTQSVVRLQEIGPTREAADAHYRRLVERAKQGDANDRLYQVEASMDYDPSAGLEKITAKLLAINFADDELNPPALGVMEPAIARIKGARTVLIPASDRTQGHMSNQHAALWAAPLGAFLRSL